jgi:hypothetical protein
MVEEENIKYKKMECPYVPEKRQVYHALMKTWQDYYNQSKEQVPDKVITALSILFIHCTAS